MTERFPVEPVPDRPELALHVDGARVDPLLERDVIEVDVSEDVNRHGRLTMLLHNWDPDRGEVRHSDDGPFPPGAEIDIRLGYHSELETVFSGVVVSLGTHFPRESAPVLRVEARARSILLAQSRRSRVFEDTSDGDVADAIATDYGLEGDTQPGVAQGFVVVDDSSDWDFLVERAQTLGWVVYVRGTTLAFRPPARPEGDVPKLEWGLNLTELHVTQDVSRVAEPTVATGWDPETLEPIEADADEGRAGVPVGERSGHGAALGTTEWPALRRTLASTSPLSPEEVERRALGQAEMDGLRHVSGTGSTIGIPGLRADSWVSIGRVGSRMAGPHYVSGVRHRLSARGFVTEFQLGIVPPLRPAHDVSCQPGSLRLGIVEDLDDPLGWGRVKVAFPWRTDAPEAIWARLAVLEAGPDHGTWFVPDVGQEVVVGSVGDDRHAVVLGSLWNGTQQPPVTIDPEENAVRSIVTRSGHRITFDDGDAASVEIATAGGHLVKLSDQDGSIEVTESGGNNKLSLSGDGIGITAGQGDITISAPTGKVKIDGSGLEAKATGPASVESSATLEVKAAATLSVRGALVNIN